jgi:hypothetical protein
MSDRNFCTLQVWEDHMACSSPAVDYVYRGKRVSNASCFCQIDNMQYPKFQSQQRSRVRLHCSHRSS